MHHNTHSLTSETQHKKEYHPPKLVDYGEISKITRFHTGQTNDGISEGSQPQFPVPPRDAPG